jgi:deoxyribonuclease-4
VKRLIGAHMLTTKGLGQAVRNGKEIGCSCVQVFTSAPMQWREKKLTDEMVDDLRAAIRETGMGEVCSHAIYLLNLASPDPANLEKSRQAYAQELRRSKRLGIPYSVVHVGKHMESGEEAGVKTLAESVGWLLRETEGEADIALETDAGQGTCIGHRFEQLAQVIEANKGHERLKVCLDTCHIFVAGYDIRTPAAFGKVVDEFDKVIGLDRLVCIHANDTKKGLGSRVDRHQHIGEGEIGIEAFRFLVNDKRLRHAPIYIETPEMATMSQVNVKRLLDLVK